MPVMLRGASPVFESVTVCTADVVPTGWELNARLAGSTPAFGAGGGGGGGGGGGPDPVPPPPVSAFLVTSTLLHEATRPTMATSATTDRRSLKLGLWNANLAHPPNGAADPDSSYFHFTSLKASRTVAGPPRSARPDTLHMPIETAKLCIGCRILPTLKALHAFSHNLRVFEQILLITPRPYGGILKYVSPCCRCLDDGPFE